MGLLMPTNGSEISLTENVGRNILFSVVVSAGVYFEQRLRAAGLVRDKKQRVFKFHVFLSRCDMTVRNAFFGRDFSDRSCLPKYNLFFGFCDRYRSSRSFMALLCIRSGQCVVFVATMFSCATNATNAFRMLIFPMH